MNLKQWMWGAALMVGGLLLKPGSARADVIDRVLGQSNGAQAIFEYLQEKGYKNVGVLRFQVQKGGSKTSPKDATFHADYFNDLMATRLENALINVQPEEEMERIGITRAATHTIGEIDKRGKTTSTFATPEGRAKLFNHTYTRAWADKSVKAGGAEKKVKVDAFLTGMVEYSKDYKTIRIKVWAFDKKNPAKFEKVIDDLTTSPDRAALRDVGKSFVLTKRSSVFPDTGPVTSEKVDSTVSTAITDDPIVTLKSLEEYLDLKVVMGDKWEGDKLIGETVLPLAPSEFGAKLDGLLPTKVVAFKMTAKTQVGLFLMVNGINSLNREPYDGKSPQEYSWWVLEKAREYYVRGYATKDKDGKSKLEEFVVVLPGEETPTDLGPDVKGWGVIELSVFVDGKVLVPEPRARFVEKPADSLRIDLPPGGTLDMVKRSIAAKGSLKDRIFVVGRNEKMITLESTEFNGVHVATLKIRYYDPDAPK